jgi:hypothetical protein
MSTARAAAVSLREPTAVSIQTRALAQFSANHPTGGGALTCIEDNRLTCDPNTLERGRPLCRLTGEGQ